LNQLAVLLQVVRRGDLVWIVDLGCDAVYQYRLQEDLLSSYTFSILTTFEIVHQYRLQEDLL
jgi:hypothetical protein